MNLTRRQTAKRWCEATENINPPDSEEGMVCAELRALWAIKDTAKVFVDTRNDAPPEDKRMPLYLDHKGSALGAALDAYEEGQG